MHDLIKQRLKAQKARAVKRKANDPLAIDTPRTQQRNNRRLADAAAELESRRQEEIRAKQEAAKEEAAKRAAQKRAAQQLAAADVEMPDASNSRESVPRERARARGSVPVPLPTPRLSPLATLPGPEFVAAPTWEKVSAVSTQCSSCSIDDLKHFVRGSLDLAVLCAPRPDGEVRTWNELAAPPADSPCAAEWTAWLSPAKWKNMSEAWRVGNTHNLEVVTEAGNYNDVLEASDATPVDDSSRWPPQLRGSGVAVADETPITATLPGADFVIRMTRTDAFPREEGEKPVYRAMKLESVVSEMSLALHAAARGIGPPIYAAVACPWDLDERGPSTSVEHTAREKRYGMIIIMRKAEGNMANWAFRLRRMQPKSGSTNGPLPELRRSVEEAADFLVKLCFQIGSTQHINYDMKMGNLLMHEVSGNFYMTDFDVMYYRYIHPEVAGVKACFFVNLLLLAMHVRAYADSNVVANALLGVFGPILAELWDEAVNSPATFGQGVMWLKLAKIAPTHEVGSFNHRILAKLAPGPRLGRQLGMMVFEYLFDTSDGRRPPAMVTQWPHWARAQTFLNGYKPLIPQLMRFALLYNRPVPDALRSIFDPEV
jgi:hypothetical protein